MDPTWCQNVTQDGSFHGTKDGVCVRPAVRPTDRRPTDRHTDQPTNRPSTDRPTDRPSDSPTDRTYPYQAGTHIPHPLCRESYHLGSHFGTIWGWIGWVLGGFKTVFLWFWGVLKFVKNSLLNPFGECREPVPTLPLGEKSCRFQQAALPGRATCAPLWGVDGR